LTRTTLLLFDEAVERVRAELKAEGFGVLCEIDVQATMRQKLGVEEEPYLILGACNPPLAHQALQAEPELGVLLPCNVIVYERDGKTQISAIDPERMLSIVDNERLGPVAAKVKERLGAVVERACTACGLSAQMDSRCVPRTRSSAPLTAQRTRPPVGSRGRRARAQAFMPPSRSSTW